MNKILHLSKLNVFGQVFIIEEIKLLFLKSKIISPQRLCYTEKYWCGIKHQEGGTFHVPPHHSELAEYADEEMR